MIYGFMIEMLLTAIIMFALGRYGAKIFIQVLRIPPVILASLLVPMTFIGAYSIQNSIFDIWMCLAFGIIGYVMEKTDIPVAPAVLAVILGPMAEVNLRRGLLINHGDYSFLIDRPISVVILGLTIFVLVYPLIKQFRYWKRARSI